MLISLIVAASAVLFVHKRASRVSSLPADSVGIPCSYSLLHRITHTHVRRKLGIPPDAEIAEDPYPCECQFELKQDQLSPG